MIKKNGQLVKSFVVSKREEADTRCHAESKEQARVSKNKQRENFNRKHRLQNIKEYKSDGSQYHYIKIY